MKLKSILAAGLFSSLFSVSVQAENLIEIYRLALDNDPLFRSQGAQLEASLENQNQSFASLMPSLSGSYTRGYNKNGSESGIGTATQSESQSDALGLSLRQTIYDYSTWVGYDQAKKRAEQARIIYRANQQDLVIRVAQVYLNVLSAQDNLEFVLAEQKAIKQELEQTKQRYEVGLIAITDVHEAQARYDQSEADRITAQNSLDNANEALREVTGQYHSDLGTLKKDIPLASPEPARIDDWVSVAKESNLDVIASNMEYYIAKQDVKRRYGGHLPSVDLTASYSDTVRDPSGIDIDTETYGLSGGISVNVPLYLGGSVNSSVRQGEALSKKASYD
ncbi:MAG: TolC family outer membrane protein, partial [Gammaproteobacteria bacterium]|nr:TolC family outer membrane protein [Gammaproteobacteria bacterium]